jgi:hypothetical protein
MATTFFNDIKDLQIVAAYNPNSDKTMIHLLIDTAPRRSDDPPVHEECVLMIRGTPSVVREKLKDAFKHFFEAKEQ